MEEFKHPGIPGSKIFVFRNPGIRKMAFPDNPIVLMMRAGVKIMQRAKLPN